MGNRSISKKYATAVLLISALLQCAYVQCAYAADSPTTNPTTYQSQRAFDKPELAVTTLADAVKTRDTKALDDIFGPEGRSVLTSGDPVADKNAREVFTVAFAEQWKLVDDGTDKKELVIGNEQWPFPIPLQKDSHGWWFDTAAGKEEVRARRIGRNELATIGICSKYADAQHEYASVGHDGKPAGLFAQKVHSDDGKHNGLYWPRAQGDSKSSPLGEFAARATKEGYNAGGKDTAAPYYGYFYRILTRQGAAADGGAKDYIVNGDMTGGFALIAWPAEYGNSGIMTFIVGPDGVVHEDDLGADTPTTAAAITEYNPDDDWDIAK
jgi:Protein of unknown function (DUF2950)